MNVNVRGRDRIHHRPPPSNNNVIPELEYPNTSTYSYSINSNSYDDELSHQLKLARSQDRRGWEERQRVLGELRGYNVDNNHHHHDNDNGGHSNNNNNNSTSISRGQGQSQHQRQGQRSNLESLIMKEQHKQQQQPPSNQPNIQPRENSTQSTRSETSSERSRGSQTSLTIENHHHHPWGNNSSSSSHSSSWMQQRIGTVVGGVTNNVYGTKNNVDLRKVRNREVRVPQQQSQQQQNQQQQNEQQQPSNQQTRQNQDHQHHHPQKQHHEHQQQQESHSNSTTITTARQTPPPPILGPIAEEESSPIHNIAQDDWSFDEIHVRGWSFDQEDDYYNDNDGHGNCDKNGDSYPVGNMNDGNGFNHNNNSNSGGDSQQQEKQFDDEVQFDDDGYLYQNGPFGDEYQYDNDDNGPLDLQMNNNPQPQSRHHQQQHNQHLQFKPHPKKPSLTIDVVSDVSYHDDPSIDMMSSLATNDTNSLTDYNWRNSAHYNRSSPTLDQYVVEEVDEESDEDGNVVKDEKRLQPSTHHHPIKEKKRETSHVADPPGTLIDDIHTSRGRYYTTTTTRLYHGRDPSVGGDSTRYSQPSVVRRMPPRGLSESPGRDRPWRQSTGQQYEQQPPTSRHSYESSRPSRNSYPLDPSQSSRGWQSQQPQQQQQQPDEDPWDIEFVVTPDAHPACEASSLGNLTGEYDLPPPNGENDDDTATNTMNTVDLVAEVKRVWRHVQKYEKKKERKKSLMAQYQTGGGDEDRGVQDAGMEEMMGHFQEMNQHQHEVSLDDTRVSELTGFSQIHSSGAAMRSYGAGVPNNSGGRRSPLEQHIEETRGHTFQNNSPGQSYNNASHASTEKDVAFVNDGVDLFFDQSQAPMNPNVNNMNHPRVPLSHHQKTQQTNYGHYSPSIPLSHHQKEKRIPESKKSNDSHLAQPYDMTKSRSTGTALSSKTQKTSNRAPNNISLYTQNYQEALSKKSGSTKNPPSSPRQDYIQTHKSRVDMARRYMKQHGRFPRSQSPNTGPPVVSEGTAGQTSEVVNGNARITVEHGNGNGNGTKHTSFRVA